MPPYVRKAPLAERIRAAVDIYDWNLWLREEIESRGWDKLEQGWALPVGLVFNLIFLIARANVDRTSRGYDDVFGESTSSGWGSALAWSMTISLTSLCLINTIYALFRERTYRLFEADVNIAPQTPSARRVKLESSPMSSPLRFLSGIWSTETAESRAHPDRKEDVWEIAVWDPIPVSLKLFCYFSPGHIILYWMFLPTIRNDPSPSMTIFRTIILGLLISAQLSFISQRFAQQAKDAALISKEVLHEYDVKYVKPNTRPLYRDVGTQFTEAASHSQARDERYNNVETYKPAFVINRGFRVNPNPDYLSQNDAAALAQSPSVRLNATPDLRSSVVRQDFSSPIRPQTVIRQPNFRSTSTAGGGSLGVYSHAASPLRKSASTNFSSKGGYLEDVSRSRGSQSPEKRRSTPASGFVNTQAASQRWGHLKPDRSRRETDKF